MDHVDETEACTLYLVRHGTTTMNVENRYRGRRDVPLDAQGWADAVEAARHLSPIGLAAVYAGPLRRTINTAQVIADECRIPDVRILHSLVNVDYGEWEGMTVEEASMYDPHAYKLYSESPQEAICPNGERLSDAQARMLGSDPIDREPAPRRASCGGHSRGDDPSRRFEAARHHGHTLAYPSGARLAHHVRAP
jgi:hypothetical protein